MAIKIQALADKAVTTAGTAEAITTSNLAAPSVTIQARLDNTGNIFVGDSNVSDTQCFVELTPGDVISFEGEDRAGKGRDEYILSDFFIDSAQNGDGIHIGNIGRRQGTNP